MWFFSFYPQKIGTVLQGSDAIQYATFFACTSAELEQITWQALRTQEFAVAFDDNVASAHGFCRNFFNIEEGVVLVAQIARCVGDSDP